MADAQRVDRARILAWLQDYGVYIAVGALLLVNALITPNFFSVANIQTQAVQVAPVVIVALGMALVIGTEGVDLSVGSSMALAAAVLPLYLGYGAGVAIAVALAAGAGAGLVNGALVAFVGIQPILATLALLVGGRGLALVIADGQLKQIENPALLSLGAEDIAGIPILVAFALVLTLGVAFLVKKTTFGRHLVAVGDNRVASQLAGLPVGR
ncbi:MAG TPA: ABC transporter permease, partial [Polyangiaceae bacterium]|nr:ABC transporter permease [Polyangiaceae bacterium]